MPLPGKFIARFALVVYTVKKVRNLINYAHLGTGNFNRKKPLKLYWTLVNLEPL